LLKKDCQTFFQLNTALFSMQLQSVVLSLFVVALSVRNASTADTTCNQLEEEYVETDTVTHRSMLMVQSRRKMEMAQTELNLTNRDTPQASSGEKDMMMLADTTENENNIQENDGKCPLYRKTTKECFTPCHAPEKPIYECANNCKEKLYVRFWQGKVELKVRACDLIDKQPLLLPIELEDQQPPAGFWDLDRLRCPTCEAVHNMVSPGTGNDCTRSAYEKCLKGGSLGGECKVDEIAVPKGVRVHYYKFPAGWGWHRWWDWRNGHYRGTIDQKHAQPNQPKDTRYINFKFKESESPCAFHFQYE